MPSASQSARIRSIPPNQRSQNVSLSVGVQADLAALRAAIVAVTAKLNADGGVTDADYAATCDPAALRTTT